MDAATKQRRPIAAAVTAVVVQRMTSMATIARPAWRGTLDAKQSIVTVRRLVLSTVVGDPLRFGLGAETALVEGVGVQPPTVDLDP